MASSLYTIAAQIVSVFETGVVQGDPGSIGDRHDGAGLTGGLHQGTDKSGALDAIVLDYVNAKAKFSTEFARFIPWLAANGSVRDPGGAVAQEFITLFVKTAKEDPVFLQVQEGVFSRLYWQPSQAACDELGLVLPLSRVCLYDLWIQSGAARLAKLRLQFPAVPPVRGGDERTWVTQLLGAREAFLLSSETPAVRASVYRVHALQKLAAEGRWSLTPPFTVWGRLIPA